MAIKKGDIKIFRSERLTDFDDGGGFITGIELANNQSNNIFPDVSDTDRTMGNVSMRKVFPSVASYGEELLGEDGAPVLDATGKPVVIQETFMSANLIITKNPEDPAVSALAFTTSRPKDMTASADVRKDAANAVENYLIKGTALPGQMRGQHAAGQKTLALMMRVTDDTPKVGQTLYLVQDEGKPSEINQYVKISSVDAYEREIRIEGEDKPVVRKFVDCQLFNALLYNFDGGKLTIFDDIQGRAKVRETAVVDAARYYGVAEVVNDVKIGDLKIQVETPYGQLIPSAESAISITDRTAGSDATPSVKSGGEINVSIAYRLEPNSRIHAGIGIMPGTLTISVSGGNLTDRDGQLMSGDKVIGTVDYGAGLITFGGTSPVYSGNKTMIFTASVKPFRLADTASIYVDDMNRSTVYNITIDPTPEPGALVVRFRALDNWYELRDMGSGILKGRDDSHGVGTVDYVTGTVSVTLGALPDVDTSIMFAWGTKTTYFDRSNQKVESPTIEHQLETGNISKGSLVLTWNDGEKEYKAQDDGAGNITGDVTGYINYLIGLIRFKSDRLLSPKLEIKAEYTCADDTHRQEKQDSNVGLEGGKLKIKLDDKNIVPGSVRVEIPLEVRQDTTTQDFSHYLTPASSLIQKVHYAEDNGKGGFSNWNGSINYATGEIELTPYKTVTAVDDKWRRNENLFPNMGGGLFGYARSNNLVHDGFKYVERQAHFPKNGGYYVASYLSADEAVQLEEEIVIDGYGIDLTPHVQETVVPNSVMFSFGGKTYVDRDGALYTDIDPQNGAGAYSGTLDYQTGIANLFGWASGGAQAIKVHSLLTEINNQPIDYVVFNVPSAPVQARSLQVRATTLNGERITATADGDSKIKGDYIDGEVDTRTGIVSVKFGRTVKAEGNEEEFWFDPKNVDSDGNIWQPIPVLADTIKYNAVVTDYLPIDADILGIDPVRLPNDGRVPIFRKGDLAVLHREFNKRIDSIESGHVVDLGETRLTDVWIEDANGKEWPCKHYSLDRVQGKITIQETDTAGYELPLHAVVRIEDQAQISDVQINGEITVTRAISHNYPKGAMLSSALFIGDMQARYSNLFTQQTWTGKWTDDRESGNETDVRYNDTEYPILVTNADAVQQRWRVEFTTTTAFKLIGETLGQVGIGSITEDLKPINPNTGEPYFILRKEGWSTGAKQGNILRFNTIGANFPIWLIRSVQQSQPTELSDGFSFRVRGHINKNGENDSCN